MTTYWTAPDAKLPQDEQLCVLWVTSEMAEPHYVVGRWNAEGTQHWLVFPFLRVATGVWHLHPDEVRLWRAVEEPVVAQSTREDLKRLAAKKEEQGS